MSAYMTGIIIILCLNIIIAYSVFLPAAAGQLNLGAAGFMIIGAYMDAYLSSADEGLGLPILLTENYPKINSLSKSPSCVASPCTTKGRYKALLYTVTM